MKGKAITILAVALMGASAMMAQEIRNEVSVQGAGFFTRNVDNQGFTQRSTDSGGVLAGYRFNVNRWLSAEANYGFTRNSQLLGGATFSRIQSDVHIATADAVVKLPVHVFKLSPYVLAGGGALAFHPRNDSGVFVPGADTQSRGAFLYGVGTDYSLSHNFGLRAEYRGFVYKAPDFLLSQFKTDTWTHTAQPSAGIVFRF